MINTRETAEEYRLAHWAEITQRRQDSGQSIKGFCKAEGIYPNVYFYWQRKLREAACKRLPELQAAVKNQGHTVPAFTEVKLEELPPPQPMLPLPATPSRISVEIKGAKITTDSAYPADQLAALCRELARPC